MNLEGLRIQVFKNHYKKQDNHPDYKVVISDSDRNTVAEAGAYIATDKETGKKKRDKNGNTYMFGTLKRPRDRQNQSSGNPGTNQAQSDQDPDGDVPF